MPYYFFFFCCCFTKQRHYADANMALMFTGVLFTPCLFICRCPAMSMSIFCASARRGALFTRACYAIRPRHFDADIASCFAEELIRRYARRCYAVAFILLPDAADRYYAMICHAAKDIRLRRVVVAARDAITLPPIILRQLRYAAIIFAIRHFRAALFAMAIAFRRFRREMPLYAHASCHCRYFDYHTLDAYAAPLISRHYCLFSLRRCCYVAALAAALITYRLALPR